MRSSSIACRHSFRLVQWTGGSNVFCGLVVGPNLRIQIGSFRAPLGILRRARISDRVGGTWSCMFSAVDPAGECPAAAGGGAPGRPVVRVGCGEACVLTYKGASILTKSVGAAICRGCAAQSHILEGGYRKAAQRRVAHGPKVSRNSKPRALTFKISPTLYVAGTSTWVAYVQHGQ